MQNNDLLYAALQDAGIPAPKIIKSSGFIRWGTNNRFWALCVGDGFVFGDWSKGIKQLVFPKNARLITRQEQEQAWAKVRAEVERERQEYERRNGITAKLATDIWEKSSPDVPPTHPYLLRKQIEPYGIKYDIAKNALVVPLRDAKGKLWNIQTITANGTKRYLAGGRKKGCFLQFGSLNDPVFCIAEGVATGKSIYDAIGCAVFVAFDAGNIESVANALLKKYATKKLIICADNDWEKPVNTGRNTAINVAQKLGITAFIPKITTAGMSDWNDIACNYGLAAVREQFNKGGIL